MLPHTTSGHPWKLIAYFTNEPFDQKQRDGVEFRGSVPQSVYLGFIFFVKSYQKALKNSTHSFPACRLAFRRGCGEQASKFVCCVLGQGT